MSALWILRRDELELLPRVALGKPSRLKPGVWRIETPQGPMVIKDARRNGFGTRWLARLLIARERRVLARLNELDGVPHLVASIDSDAIALTLIPGQALDARLFRERPRVMFDELRRITDRLHAVGVFHLDLHQRKNLIVDDEGRLHLVDFGAALAPGPLICALVGRVLRHADHQAAYKYLARFAPEELTDEEARTVVRYRMIRRLWPFSPHSRREHRAARARLSG